MLFMKKLLFFVLTCLAVVVSNAQMTPGSVATPNGTVFFLSYTPGNYRPTGTGHPLIISLGGVGERGDGSSNPNTGLNNLYNGGIPLKIKQGSNMVFTYQGYTDGFVVLAPQLPTTSDWQNFYIDAMVSYGLANFNIDPNRIFLTGYSLGGTGTWNYAASSPNINKFAAILPVSSDYVGGANFCNIAGNKVGVWALQGANDDVYTPIGGVSRAHLDVNAINTCGNLVIPAFDTAWANEVHGTGFWDTKVYAVTNDYLYPNLYQYMLKVNRGINIPTNAAPNPVINAVSSLTVTAPFKIRDFPVLDGSGATDDDIIVNYRWGQTNIGAPNNVPNGPATIPDITIANDDRSRQQPIFRLAPGNAVGIPIGNYVFTYRVKDYLTSLPGHTQTRSFTLNVQANPSGHMAPAVWAGPDVVLATNQTFVQELGNWDVIYPGSQPAGYAWRFISGPQTPTLLTYDGSASYGGDGNGVRFTNMTTPGNYVFEFAVRNNFGDVGKDSLTITRLGALPVSYAYINGQNLGSKNVISWATTQELNSDRFDITRSSDGQNFSTVGTVVSRGGNTQTAYSFEDNNIPVGTSYYRLSQVDKDGGTHLSKIVTLVRRKAGIYVDRFPNPAKNTLTVTVQGESNGNIHVLVADMQGRPVLQQQWQKTQPQINRTLNISALQSGVYQMSITSGTEKQVLSFVKY
jgi:hypothetical protein